MTVQGTERSSLLPGIPAAPVEALDTLVRRQGSQVSMPMARGFPVGRAHEQRQSRSKNNTLSGQGAGLSLSWAWIHLESLK